MVGRRGELVYGTAAEDFGANLNAVTLEEFELAAAILLLSEEAAARNSNSRLVVTDGRDD